jgi:hypothetical protein
MRIGGGARWWLLHATAGCGAGLGCRFGYNVARTMVDGLNYGGSAAATDFATIAYQLR